MAEIDTVIERDALLSDVYKDRCPKCKNKTFKVSADNVSISVRCAKCKRRFLTCWNEWVLNYD